jgi:hypothetical protein
MSSVDDGTAQPGPAVVGARERMEYYAISNRRQRRRAQPAENTQTRPNILNTVESHPHTGYRAGGNLSGIEPVMTVGTCNVAMLADFVETYAGCLRQESFLHRYFRRSLVKPGAIPVANKELLPRLHCKQALKPARRHHADSKAAYHADLSRAGTVSQSAGTSEPRHQASVDFSSDPT